MADSATMWRSKLGASYPKKMVESLHDQHLNILRSLRKQPHNARCADCGEAETSWASVNLGVFICVQCADVHRGLGTHISKVKGCGGTYLWGPDEVGRMQQFGNAAVEALCSGRAGPRPPLGAGKEERTAYCRRKYEGLVLPAAPVATATSAAAPAATPTAAAPATTAAATTAAATAAAAPAAAARASAPAAPAAAAAVVAAPRTAAAAGQQTQQQQQQQHQLRWPAATAAPATTSTTAAAQRHLPAAAAAQPRPVAQPAAFVLDLEELFREPVAKECEAPRGAGATAAGLAPAADLGLDIFLEECLASRKAPAPTASPAAMKLAAAAAPSTADAALLWADFGAW